MWPVHDRMPLVQERGALSNGINSLLKTERAFVIIKFQRRNACLKNTMFHIDVNSAFLRWEAVYRLAHKGGKQDLREIASVSRNKEKTLSAA